MVSKHSNLLLDQLFKVIDFQESIDLIPGSVFIKDLNGVYLAVNNELKNMANMDPTGMTDFDLVTEEEAEMLKKNDKKVIESKKTMVFIEKFHLPKGQLFTACAIKASFFDKTGNLIGIIGHGTKLEEG